MAAILISLFSAAASAQQRPIAGPSIDPRVSGAAINALQAIVALREAEIKALTEDLKKREDDWATYSAPLWQPGTTQP